MIEHYSHKIQNAIQKELFKANKSIKIAVAWFTNDLLFQPLLLKLAAGVTVEIILNKDEINCSNENEIDFDEFVNAGGTLRWNDTKQLLHDKFCIIDDRIVIYGSYNWTNKAEYNEESIAIAKEENETIEFYCDKFEKLSNKYKAEAPIVRPVADNLDDVADSIIESETENYTINIINQSFVDEVCLNKKFPSHMYITNSAGNTSSTIYNEYPNLNFYDELITPPYSSSFDTAFHFVGKNNNQLYLLDSQYFSPINDFCFSDYKCVGDYDLRQYPKLQIIWLKVDGKWGLFDKEKRKFCIPPICDDFRNPEQDFTQFVIIIDGKFGVADINGNIVLDWVFDDINIITNDCFRIKMNEKYAIIKSGHLQIVYDKEAYCGITTINGKYGLISIFGSIIMDFIYDKIEYMEPFGCGYYVFHKGGKCGLRVAKTGKMTPCIYNNYEDLPIWGYSGEDLVLKKGTPLV